MTQPATSLAPYRGVWDCAAQTWKEEGMKAFYKGVLPNWMRKAPWCVVFFVVYEEMRTVVKMRQFQMSSVHDQVQTITRETKWNHK
jgi:hypothetical protein